MQAALNAIAVPTLRLQLLPLAGMAVEITILCSQLPAVGCSQCYCSLYSLFSAHSCRRSAGGAVHHVYDCNQTVAAAWAAADHLGDADDRRYQVRGK